MASPKLIILPAGAYKNVSNAFMYIYGNDTVTMTDESGNQVDIDNLPTWLPPNFTLTPTNNTERLIALKGDIEDFRGFLSSANPPATAPTVVAMKYATTGAITPTTAATSEAMMGISHTASFTFTPVGSGNVVVILTGAVTVSSTSGIFAVGSVRYGTGTSPISGAAVTGTIADSSPTAFSAWVQVGSQTSIASPLTIVVYIKGLTLNTAYWFDITADSGAAGGTSTFRGTLSVIEQAA